MFFDIFKKRFGNDISYYDLLGVNKRATTDEINKKFKKVMLDYHTDRNPDGAVMCKIFSEAKNTLTDQRARAIYDAQQGYSSYSSSAAAGGGGQHSWWTGAADEMSKPPEFPTFTAMLKDSNCEEMANKLKQLADHAVAHGEPTAGVDGLLNDLKKCAEDHGLGFMIAAFTKALKSKFRCSVCGTKGIPLDNVCYCSAAMANCHCAPKCCRTTLKDRGKLY